MNLSTHSFEQSHASSLAESRQYLTFTVDREEYGVNIIQVREIKAWSHITRLPNTPEYMLGVMNLRGTIIPIFDLRARFGKERVAVNPKNVVIIVALESRMIGILVETVSDIIDADPSNIQPPPTIDGDEKSHLVDGLISLEGRMVVLLDIEQLFDQETLDRAATAM